MRIETWRGAVAFCAEVTGFALVVGHLVLWLSQPHEFLWSEFWMQTLVVMLVAPPISLWGGFQIRDGTLAMDKLRYLADHDDLTGLLIRRRFLQILTDQGDSAGQLLIADIDHFKRVNDGLGHLAGDQVIIAVAQKLKAAVGSSGIVGRFGGEEFIVFLKGLDANQGLQTADRLRQIVGSEAINASQPVTVTLSIGVSSIARAQDLEAGLQESDAALYAAKAAGRNRVRHFQSISTENEFAIRIAAL